MTSWVLNGRDPTEAKTSVESRLALEESRLAELEAAGAASAALAKGMVDILASFERRLEKLEETILPVYHETENLQRRQENIDRTLEALDHVIAFHNVSKEVESTVRGGPEAVSLEEFLQAMSRLKGALDYFERNNPQSIELENVRTLHGLGGDALSREFSEVIKRHSKPVPPVDILNSLSEEEATTGPNSGNSKSVDKVSNKSSGNDDDFASIQHFAEEVQTGLIAVAEWLNLNDRDEFMNVYASVRGQVMRKSLDQLRDYQRSASGGRGNATAVSPAASRKFSSPDTPTGKKVSRISSSLNRRFSTLSNRMEAATGLAVGRRSLGTPIAEEGGPVPGGEMEVSAFCLAVSALQRLMASEQTLMKGIVPHQYQVSDIVLWS